MEPIQESAWGTEFSHGPCSKARYGSGGGEDCRSCSKVLEVYYVAETMAYADVTFNCGNSGFNWGDGSRINARAGTLVREKSWLLCPSQKW